MKKTKLLFEQLYIYTLLINKIYNSILIINLIIFYYRFLNFKNTKY